MINFTGIQPSGDLTLGNYIGSIKNFKKNNNKNCNKNNKKKRGAGVYVYI